MDWRLFCALLACIAVSEARHCVDATGRVVSPGEEFFDGCNWCKCAPIGVPSICTMKMCNSNQAATPVWNPNTGIPTIATAGRGKGNASVKYSPFSADMLQPLMRKARLVWFKFRPNGSPVIGPMPPQPRPNGIPPMIMRKMLSRNGGMQFRPPMRFPTPPNGRQPAGSRRQQALSAMRQLSGMRKMQQSGGRTQMGGVPMMLPPSIRGPPRVPMGFRPASRGPPGVPLWSMMRPAGPSPGAMSTSSLMGGSGMGMAGAGQDPGMPDFMTMMLAKQLMGGGGAGGGGGGGEVEGGAGGGEGGGGGAGAKLDPLMLMALSGQGMGMGGQDPFGFGGLSGGPDMGMALPGMGFDTSGLGGNFGLGGTGMPTQSLKDPFTQGMPGQVNPMDQIFESMLMKQLTSRSGGAGGGGGEEAGGRGGAAGGGEEGGRAATGGGFSLSRLLGGSSRAPPAE